MPISKNQRSERNCEGSWIRTKSSKNSELFQTKQEKSLCYKSASGSVNTRILYEKGIVISLGTISDDKSQKALATVASITEMLKFTKLTVVDKLFIVSDIPTSQYRNKQMMFSMKPWTKNNKIDV